MKKITKKVLSLILAASMILPFFPSVNADASENLAEVSVAPAACDLIYTGQYQPLVTAGTAQNGIMMYSLEENGDYYPDVPAAVNAGEYFVYYYAQGVNGFEDSEVGFISASINKADAVIEKAPIAKELVYNGSSQALLIPGEATGGTMLYNKFGSNESGFSAAIPTGNMGYYEVWYYVKGDANHNSTEKYKIGVTIEKAVIPGPIDVEIAAPVVGAAPQRSISRDKYSAQIIWSPSDSVFVKDKEYSASVTITPKVSRAYRFDTEETLRFKAKMREEGWTIYGDEDSLSMNKTFSTKEKTRVTVTAQDQTIVYGEEITLSGYSYSSENTQISVSAKLIPSTNHVTVNGKIELGDVVVTQSGEDITADCELILNPGKLVINPDVSKIENLTAENVTSGNAADIEAVRRMMDEAETEGIDTETKASYDAIIEHCRVLSDRIRQVQVELTRIEDGVNAYDGVFVKSSDEIALSALAADIAALLNTRNLTAEERTRLESQDAETAALLAVIEAAAAARKTKRIEDSQGITAENVTWEDRTVLAAAAEDLHHALEIYAAHYTEAELKEVEEEIARLDGAEALLDQVEEVRRMVDALPESVDPEHSEIVEKVNEAKEAYAALSEHGKTLAGEEIKKKLDNIIIHPEKEEVIPVYRVYNPYTNEHLLTGDKAERDALLAVGWTLDGIAWNAPKTGTAVYRLYNPYDDWHTYSVNPDEIEMLTALGWKVDGVVTVSASSEEGIPIYRLFNPYELKNYHLITATSAERDFLIGLGWKLDGVAWFAAAG